MPYVMLRAGWPGTFHRTVKRKKGTEVLEFPPKVPVKLSAADAKLLADDIGVALMPVDLDPKERARVINDDVIPDEGLSGQELGSLDDSKESLDDAESADK